VDEDDLSRLLFGRAGRLRFARWVLTNVREGDYFYATQVRNDLGDVPEEIKANLVNLQELGAIKRAHRDAGSGRRQYFQRVACPAWTVFEAALDLVTESSIREKSAL
jgi:hypothetical protein